MNIKSEINWTKSAIALVLLCVVFSFSAMAQNNPNKPLNENEVRILVSRLKERLKETDESFPVLGEDKIEEIFKLWDARRNLVGKTRAQVIDLLHSDYLSFPNDREEYYWESWVIPGIDDEPLQEATKTETPVEPAVEPEKHGNKEPSEPPVEPNSIRYYFANLPTDADTEAWEPGLQKAVGKSHLAIMVGLVFHKDKDGNLTGTGSFDLAISPHKGLERVIQIIESKEIEGKKIVITGTKKPK